MQPPTSSSDAPPSGERGGDDGRAEPGPLERAADEAVRRLQQIPPLAMFAVVAALFELALSRVAWHGLTDIVPDLELLEVRRWARFPRNLAAVCGIVALTSSLLYFLRAPGNAPIGRRLAVAAFAGIFVPSIIVATVLPEATLRRRLVVFGLAAANVLVTLLGMSAVRYRPGRGLRVAVVGATLTSFLSLAVVGLGQLVHARQGLWAPLAALFVEHPTSTQRFLLALRHGGEIAWLCALFGASWAIVRARPRPGSRRRLALALGLAAASIAAILWFQGEVGHRFRLVLFGSFRVSLLVDHAPWLYALPIGVAFAAALVGLGRPPAAVRQLSCGLLFWLVAGFGPYTPIQLLYMVLGAALMTRSAQALDPHGRWRQHHPWLRLARGVGAAQPAAPSPELDPRVERETYDDD